MISANRHLSVAGVQTVLPHPRSATQILLLAALAAVLSLTSSPILVGAASWHPGTGFEGPNPPGGGPMALESHPPYGGPTGASPRGPAVFPSGVWTNISSGSTRAPAARQGFGMAFDPVLNATVIFGGQSSAGAPLGDTWEFTKGQWTQVPQVNPPNARWGAGFAYDPELRSLLLFGGRTGAGFLGDTWTFNASGWKQLFTPTAPPPQPARHLLYDSEDRYLLLLSQSDPSGASLGYNGFWTFAAGNWTNLTGQVTLNGFANLSFESQTDDLSDGYVLLFGGTNSSSSSGAGVTWSYLHGAFTNRTGSQIVSPENGQGSDALAYDPVEQGVVMVGGRAPYGVTTTATYLFTAGRWNNMTSTAGGPPPGDWDGRLVFDPTIHSDLLYGGNRANAGATVRLTNTSWNLTVTYFPLLASVTAFPTHGDAPLVVNFTSSYGGGVPPLVPTWRFGDTNASGAASPSHAYTNPGTYTWSFNLTDRAGDARNFSGTIRVEPTLLAQAGGTPLAGAAPLVVQFHATPSGGEPAYRYSWVFGDGWPNSNLSDPEHAYANAGNYSVHWIITDMGGGRVSGTLGLRVLPTPVLVTTRTVPASASVPFTAYLLPIAISVVIAFAAVVLPQKPLPPPLRRRRVRPAARPGAGLPPYYPTRKPPGPYRRA
ncbi:MAG: PKD domain-containing protein [Thermoplasmata archaeon]|nr:PKD domain-containing protein [Thermoplasmata archaeon]